MYLVEHIKSHKYFALKSILPEDEEDLDDTINEIALQQLSAKDHRNIVKIYETYEHEKVFYLVMEWMDSGDISQMFKVLES